MGTRASFSIPRDVPRKTFKEIHDYFNSIGLLEQGMPVPELVGEAVCPCHGGFLVHEETGIYRVLIAFRNYTTTTEGRIKSGKLGMCIQYTGENLPSDVEKIIEKYNFKEDRELRFF